MYLKDVYQKGGGSTVFHGSANHSVWVFILQTHEFLILDLLWSSGMDTNKYVLIPVERQVSGHTYYNILY